LTNEEKQKAGWGVCVCLCAANLQVFVFYVYSLYTSTYINLFSSKKIIAGCSYRLPSRRWNALGLCRYADEAEASSVEGKKYTKVKGETISEKRAMKNEKPKHMLNNTHKNA